MPPRRRPQTTGARQSLAAQHRHVGWAVEAIVRVLADRQEPMQAKDIHAAVEALLGRQVAWSSIKNALASNITGQSPRFVRVAKGRYRLA